MLTCLHGKTITVFVSVKICYANTYECTKPWEILVALLNLENGMKMQRIWWLNSTLCAKVHLMTFDLYNYQTPRWPDCRTSKKNAQETLGYQKIIVPKIPPGGGGLLPAQSLMTLCHINVWSANYESMASMVKCYPGSKPSCCADNNSYFVMVLSRNTLQLRQVFPKKQYWGHFCSYCTLMICHQLLTQGHLFACSLTTHWSTEWYTVWKTKWHCSGT